MSLIVQKFGGSSVKDAQRIRNVAGIIAETYLKGNDVIVVLSAQGDTTDDLIAKAEEINPNASKREMDMLLSTGEQISCALCAMAIQALGCPVVSLTGWQAGVGTDETYGDAHIRRLSMERVRRELDEGKVVLIAGFQGVSPGNDITTLGRGGSDTTAVAAAAGNSFAAFSTVTSPNAAVESPHSRYPPQMNSFRLPTRSDSAPIRSVVSVAAAALQPTMAEM